MHTRSTLALAKPDLGSSKRHTRNLCAIAQCMLYLFYEKVAMSCRDEEWCGIRARLGQMHNHGRFVAQENRMVHNNYISVLGKIQK
jgi:hypothetical protein